MLAYIAVDFSDPFVPGVFSFETDEFFVAAAHRASATATPAPVRSPAPRVERTVDASRPVLRVRAVRPSTTPVVTRAHLIGAAAPPATSSEDH